MSLIHSIPKFGQKAHSRIEMRHSIERHSIDVISVTIQSTSSASYPTGNQRTRICDLAFESRKNIHD